MGIQIDTFTQKYAGMESTIKSAVAANDRLGDKKRDKFDVVADLIFQADKPLPILEIADWSTVKSTYAGLPSPFSMLLILAYRKRFVDREIAKFCQQYPDRPIVTKSVGSTDLTSDYDITVGITGGDISGAELDVIEKFNNEVRVSFGKQPGTIFDTNLYAKDFLALNKDDQRLVMPDVGAAMYNMLVEGQDVGALVKQRRYMPNADWITFLTTLLNEVGAPNSPAWTATQTRYETADAQYLLNIHELLGEFDARATDPKTYATAAKDYADAKAKVDAAITENVLSPAEQAFVKNAANQEMAVAQLLLRYKDLKWEHDYADMVLWATNDLYVRKMRAIRAYQREIGTSGNPAAGNVRVADLISSAIFFASEAYLSEGALRHVVEGVQVAKANPNLKGDDLAKAINNALMSLTIEELLQSINEQFGDFLKDFAHYGNTPEFLFRGAKYVQRLFEAADFLSTKKMQGSTSEQAVLKNLDIPVIDKIFAKPAAEILARLNTKNEGLVAVRKGDKKFDNDADRDAYCAAEIKTYFGADNGTGLKDRITQMILKLNAQVRSGLTTTPTLVEVQAYFKALSLSTSEVGTETSPSAITERTRKILLSMANFIFQTLGYAQFRVGHFMPASGDWERYQEIVNQAAPTFFERFVKDAMPAMSADLPSDFPVLEVADRFLAQAYDRSDDSFRVLVRISMATEGARWIELKQEAPEHLRIALDRFEKLLEDADNGATAIGAVFQAVVDALFMLYESIDEEIDEGRLDRSSAFYMKFQG